MRVWFFDWDGVIENTKGIRNQAWLKAFLISRYLEKEPVFIVTFKQNTEYNRLRDKAKLKALIEKDDKTYTYDQLISGITYANDPKLNPIEEIKEEAPNGFCGKNKLMFYTLKKAKIENGILDNILIDDSQPNCTSARTAGYQAVDVDHDNDNYTKMVDKVAAGTLVATKEPEKPAIKIETFTAAQQQQADCRCVIL